MAWNDLKAAIAAVIKTNGTQSITGPVLRSTLNTIVDQVGANATFKGLAIQTTNPGTPDGREFYIAKEAGTYSNFNAQTVARNELVIFNYNGTSWTKLIVSSDLAKIVDVTELQAAKVDKSTGKNLFNKDSSNIIDGYYLYSDGVTHESALYCISDYIKVNPLTNYVRNYTSTGNYACFYDLNLNFIGSSNLLQFETPVNAVWTRLSVLKTNLPNYQFELGTTQTLYSSFTDMFNKVSTSDIQDEAVNESKTVMFEKTRNLHNADDPNNVIGKYIHYSDGVLFSNSGYNVTEYIPVGSNKVYTMSFKHQICWFDANKIYISGSNSTDTNKTQTSPNNAAFLRCSVNINYWSTFQVEEGEIQTDFQSYYRLKNKYIDSYFSGISSFINSIKLPSKMYCLNGVQYDFFIEAFIKRWRPFNDIVKLTGTATYLRRLQRVFSINNAINNTNIVATLYNSDTFKIIETATSELIVSTPYTGTSEVKVSLIGDSYTHGAFYEDALLTKNYTPNIKLIGLRKNINYPTQYDEGRGGWKLSDYMAVTNTRTKAYNGFWQPNGTYKYWGSTHFWKLANDYRINPNGNYTFDESYNVNRFQECSLLFNATTGYKSNPVSGYMMYDNDLSSYVVYNGSAWVSTTYAAYTWSFNYSKYLEMWQLQTPSIVGIMLGLNDFRDLGNPEMIDFSSYNSNLETVINSIKSAYASVKFVIMLPCSTCGISNNSGGYFVESQNACMWSFRRNLINNFDLRTSESIYIVDAGIMIDGENGYDLTAVENQTLPFFGYEGGKRIDVQTGNPHPYNSYPNIGLPLAAIIQYLR